MIDVDVDEFVVLPAAERDRPWMDIEREQRRLHTLQLALVAAVDRCGCYSDDGHRGTRAWVQAVANCAPVTAQRTVHAARTLTALPNLAAACAAGRVVGDQLRLLAGLYTNRRCRPLLAESDTLLAGHACRLSYTDFQRVCERWEAHADPDGWQREHELAVDNRHVNLARLGHGHVLHAEGDALTGEVIAKILARYTDTEFDHDRQHGTVAARTGRQRRYDALVRIFAAADTHQPAGRRQAPLVNIICTETAANDAPHSVFDPRLAWLETDPHTHDWASGGDTQWRDRRERPFAARSLHGKLRRAVCGRSDRPRRPRPLSSFGRVCAGEYGMLRAPS